MGQLQGDTMKRILAALLPVLAVAITAPIPVHADGTMAVWCGNRHCFAFSAIANIWYLYDSAGASQCARMRIRAT